MQCTGGNIQMIDSQAVDFISNPLIYDITVCRFYIDFMVLQFSKINNNTACDVIIERIRDKIHSLLTVNDIACEKCAACSSSFVLRFYHATVTPLENCATRRKWGTVIKSGFLALPPFIGLSGFGHGEFYTLHPKHIGIFRFPSPLDP